MRISIFYRLLILMIGLFISLGCWSQSVIRGKVLDAKTQEPLAFCHIFVVQKSTGMITNEQGDFELDRHYLGDSLRVSFLGYETKTVPAEQLSEDPVIYLQSQSVALDELVVYPSDAYLYQAIRACRKKIKTQDRHSAKAYFQVSTRTEESPLELIQCYYNTEFSGYGIQAFDLKNGRVGLLGQDEWYFVSLETSRAITFLDLLTPSDRYPGNPLSLSKKQLYKSYELVRLPSFSGEEVLHISFTPKKDAGEWFSGEIWIDQTSHSLLKIVLNAENATVHPFSLIRPNDILKEVDFQITQSYQLEKGESTLQHVDFNYAFDFFSYRDSIPKNRPIATRGVLYIYDLDQPFRLPRYDYDEGFDDYRKISFLPYNPWFWGAPPKVATTTEEKSDMALFEKEGVLLNFRNNYFGKSRFWFEYNHFPWSAKERVTLKKDINKEDEDQPLEPTFESYTDKYNLDVQIFFDVNVIRDTIYCLTETIFDTFDTFYHLPEEPYTNCFINLYFDLCEIARREMEQKSGTGLQSIEGLEALYESTLRDLDRQLARFQKEVQLGAHRKNLEKWNELVKDKLGIDNIALFELNDENKGD